MDGDSEGDEDDFMDEELDDGEESEGDGGSSAPSTPKPTALSVRKWVEPSAVITIDNNKTFFQD